MNNELAELRSPWDQQLIPLKKTHRRKTDHRYVLIDCELIDVGNITDNLCAICGMNNCRRNH